MDRFKGKFLSVIVVAIVSILVSTADGQINDKLAQLMADNGVTELGVDSDGDGSTNLIELATKRNPNFPDSDLGPSLSFNGEGLTFQYQSVSNPLLYKFLIKTEESSDMINWQTLQGQETISELNGLRQISLTFDLPQNRKFYRLFVAVQTDNSPPQFNGPIPNATIDEDTTHQIDAKTYFTDEDTNLTFNVTNLSNAIWSEANGVITLDPSENYFGTISTITIVAKDSLDAETASNFFDLIVEPINDAPTFSGEISNEEIEEDGDFQIDAKTYFSDVEDADLTYSVANLTYASWEVANGVVTITPDTSFNGTISNIIIVAKDSEKAEIQSNSFDLVITPYQ